jgi:LPS-assembly protein
MVRFAIVRPPLHRRATRNALIGMALAAVVAGGSLSCDPALAQSPNIMFQFPNRPVATPPVTRRNNPDAPMLLQASEIQYDYTNKRVSAVGNVQIYHRGATLEADKVIYEETTKRMHAEGNVRLTDAEGQVTYGEIMNLSDDFRDGFVDALRLDTPNQTRMAAARADRSGGNFTVLHNGVYTACEPCKEDPKKPPLWQVKAARIIHDQGEKMIYFENAQIEFFGRPVAYMPYFSTPDPTVKRKSGFLLPGLGYSEKLGVAAQIPYYWALAPDYDLTLTPRLMTRQGLLMQGEWRQRLNSGGYSIRLTGVRQLDKDAFIDGNGNPTTAVRDWRGSVDTKGQFALNDKWIWGWDSVVPTDPTYMYDYGIPSYQRGSDPLRTGLSEGISQLYLSGQGTRSYFDVRSIYYYGFSTEDVQKQIPIIHPVMDYSYVFANPIMGGELSYRMNLTSLSRDTSTFDPITALAFNTGQCALTAAPGTKMPANCLMRGFPGTYSRFSAEAQWKRSYTDSYGQVFTPFALLRADAAAVSINSDPAVLNYGFTPGDSSEFRAMPTVGVEYRYPFINVQSWGTQTIEPIAQIIVRPNEPRIGKLPNEDSQSLLFDDGNLFKIDKFAGWDRIEGGGRANAGIQYTAQVNRGGFLNAMFGQSYQLFGTNSFAVGDASNTGLDSGLDTDVSDYVARVSYQPDRVFTFSTRYRFDHSSFDLQRFEAEARASFDRWWVSAIYGNYAAQPQIGFLERREGVLGQTSIKLGANWVATGALRYDIDAAKVDQTQIGLGYIDDCFILALNYITSYSYVVGNAGPDRRIMLQMSLRTLGDFGTSQALSQQTR